MISQFFFSFSLDGALHASSSDGSSDALNRSHLTFWRSKRQRRRRGSILEEKKDALKRLLSRIDGVPLNLTAKQLAKEMFELPSRGNDHTQPTMNQLMIAHHRLAWAWKNPPEGFEVDNAGGLYRFRKVVE